MRHIGTADQPATTTGSAFDALPAGPLSGVQLTLWRSKSGTAVHGSRDCPALARSTPTAVTHPLGVGRTLAELDWPDHLHCGVEPADPAAATYLRQAQRLSRRIPKDQAALDAIPVDVDNPAAAQAADPYRPLTWTWPTIAPPLVRALIERDTGVQIPDRDPRTPAGEATPAELAAATRHLDERLATAATELHDLLAGRQHLLDSPLAADAARAVRKVTAAERVLAGYNARTPSSLWTAYVNTGARAAHQTAEALTAGRAAPTEAGLRVLGTDTNYDRPGGVGHALDIALYQSGQESYTHHRAHARTTQPDKPWRDTLQSWLGGAHYGFGPDMPARREVGRPGIIEIVEPALAAAEQAWDAFTDGVASDRPNGCLAAVGLDTRFSSMHWKAAALLLVNPSVAVRARDGSVWLLAACAETDLDELLNLGREQSTWVRHDRTPDQAVLVRSARALLAIATAPTVERRQEQLTAIASQFPAPRRGTAPGERW